MEAELEGTIRYQCGAGTGLALFERPPEAIDRTVAAFEVEDIESEVNELRSRDVNVEGVITLPSGVKRAFFKDPDGNIIGMRQILESSAQLVALPQPLPSPVDVLGDEVDVSTDQGRHSAVNSTHAGCRCCSPSSCASPRVRGAVVLESTTY